MDPTTNFETMNTDFINQILYDGQMRLAKLVLIGRKNSLKFRFVVFPRLFWKLTFIRDFWNTLLGWSVWPHKET